MAAIDTALFSSRLSAAFEMQRMHPESFGSSDTFVVYVGDADPDRAVPSRSAVFQIFLTGYEFPNTAFVLNASQSTLTVLTTGKTAGSMLSECARVVPAPVKMAVHVIPKADLTAGLPPHFSELFKEKAGVVLSEDQEQKGRFVETVQQCLQAKTRVDCGDGISRIIRLKDAASVAAHGNSSRLAVAGLTESLVPLLEKTIDSRGKIAHSKISEQVSQAISMCREHFDSFRSISEEEASLYDNAIFLPVVMSGGTYELSVNAASDDKALHFGVIIALVGAKYREYNSLVARTYFVNPTKEQERLYRLLVEARDAALQQMVVGRKLAAVAEAVNKVFIEKQPAVKDRLLKTCGYGVGIEIKEAGSTLSLKNVDTTFAPNQVYALQIGVKDLANAEARDQRGKQYCLFLGDTILCQAEGPARNLTAAAAADPGDVSYAVDLDARADSRNAPQKQKQNKNSKRKDVDEDEDAEESFSDESGEEDNESEDGKASRKRRKTIDTDNIIEGRRSRALRAASEAKKMEEIDKKNVELLEMLMETENRPKSLDGIGGKEFSFLHELREKRIEAYRSSAALPAGLRPNEVFVDQNNSAVLFPVFGRHVPVHISAIKSLSEFSGSGFFYLRFNLAVDPAAAEEAVKAGKNPLAYVQELSFRSKDGESFKQIAAQFREMQKRLKADEAKKKQQSAQENGANQDQQPLLLDRTGNPTLYDNFEILPKIGRGKQNSGKLQAHRNGLRFASDANETVDILFSNIRYCFFQPSKTENVCLIHFHLKSPVTVGKRKVQDVQFREQVTDDVDYIEGPKNQHLTEQEAAIRERELKLMRRKLNQAISEVVDKIQKKFAAGGFPELKFEWPEDSLGFRGSPHHNLVDLMPTKSCLVSLVEPPFFVLALEDAEVAWFERIGPTVSTKNFDLSFVFKDYSRPVVRIDNIERFYYSVKQTEDGRKEQVMLDRVYDLKKWLNLSRIPYFESVLALNWMQIMKAIKEGMVEAAEEEDEEGQWHPFGENGWLTYLEGEGGAPGGGSGSGSEEGSEQDEDEEFDAGGSSEDEYEGDSDEDMDEYVESESDEDDDFEEEDDGEDEDDWDAQEERLAEEDKRRAREWGDDEGDGNAGGRSSKKIRR